jgi:cell division protein ZapA (FtsZ GTPase activity inhibitor)
LIATGSPVMMRRMSSSRQGLRSVKVQVAGQTLALRTDASTTYLRELAKMVDDRLAEVREKHGSGDRRVVSTQALALLCALQLADELHQAEDRHGELRRDVRARTERILRHLDVLERERSAEAEPAWAKQ